MRTEEIYALLEARRLELGLSQLQVGQLAFGRADSSAIQNLKRGSSPTFERLEAIATALGLELYLGPKRALSTGFHELGSPAHDLAQVNAPTGEGLLPLRWHPLTKRLGPTPFAFHGEWLDTVGIDPERLALVDPEVVYIDTEGCRDLLLIVDTEAPRKLNPQIWAFMERGHVAVGRIQFEGETVLLHPERHGQAVRVLRGNAKQATTFLGRVVWHSRIEIGLPLPAKGG